MRAIITAEFEIDVDDWSKGEGLNKSQRIKKIIEDLSDFSVFMPHCSDYNNFKSVEVFIKE